MSRGLIIWHRGEERGQKSFISIVCCPHAAMIKIEKRAQTVSSCASRKQQLNVREPAKVGGLPESHKAIGHRGPREGTKFKKMYV